MASPASPIGWDPVNRTFHFYQRQEGAWFWCGQSDMALEDRTRGQGPFDSHINGYPNMKELKAPWVHWHGPSLSIAETAYAPDDPLVSDPLFMSKQTAERFEPVVRRLGEQWNTARFEKAFDGDTVRNVPFFMRQVLEATSVNLVTTETPFSRLAQQDLDRLPMTFFFDQDCLVEAAGLQVQRPELKMTRQRYRALIARHDLRVRGGSIDQPGDVPFCFLVPERAFEDFVVVKILVQRGVMSARLAACLLMIDFPNPLGSPRRASLLEHVPAIAGLTDETNLDATLVPTLLAAATPGTPEQQFAEHWQLGPDSWRETFGDRIGNYLRQVAARLATDDGCNDIFRLAESRRREFSQMKLAEFSLTIPKALGIQDNAPTLEMTEDAAIQERPA